MGYRKVYFRIDSKYTYNNGWPNDGKAAVEFQGETRKLFQDAGWTLQPGNDSGISDTVIKGQEELYLHPMNFSGVVMEENIPAIMELLTRAVSFKCRGIDCYEEYLDLSDEDYWALLESQKKDNSTALLERYKTKRRNIYVTGEVLPSIVRKFSICRICDKEGKRNIASPYISQLFKEMIADGHLITVKTKQGIGVRTATEKERLERKPPLVDKNYLMRLAA